MNKHFIPLLVASIVVIGSSAVAQQKIGFVNSTKIFQEIPEAKEAQKKLESIREKAIQKKLDSYKAKEPLMSDAEKKTSQQEIYDIDNDGELAKQQDEILTPIKEKILKVIEKIAKQQKYSFVFDQTETVRVMVYGEPSADLTYTVIDTLRNDMTGNGETIWVQKSVKNITVKVTSAAQPFNTGEQVELKDEVAMWTPRIGDVFVIVGVHFEPPSPSSITLQAVKLVDASGFSRKGFPWSYKGFYETVMHTTSYFYAGKAQDLAWIFMIPKETELTRCSLSIRDVSFRLEKYIK